MKIRKEIEDSINELKRIRRKFHMYPEIGFNTSNTIKLVKQFINIEPILDDGISGVFYLKGNEDCIAFRCELDALNIKEENNLDYKSTNSYMHACGHDMHMAIMILLINYYLKHEHKNSLLFIFQPAEESGAGAKYMLKHNIFSKYKVKELYAFHVLPGLGDFIGCREGSIMAQSCEINISILGKSSHINEINPIDAIKISNNLLNKIYQLNKEIQPNIIHIGMINGGELCNSISSSCELKGTIRCFDSNIFISIKDRIIFILNELDKKYKSNSYVNYSVGYPLLINNTNLVKKIKKYSNDYYIEIEPLILSEDFSYYSECCDTCYMFCGLTTNESLHSSTFNLLEEDCIKMLELYIRIIDNIDI